jgi:hypothetical protein
VEVRTSRSSSTSRDVLTLSRITGGCIAAGRCKSNVKYDEAYIKSICTWYWDEMIHWRCVYRYNTAKLDV